MRTVLLITTLLLSVLAQPAFADNRYENRSSYGHQNHYGNSGYGTSYWRSNHYRSYPNHRYDRHDRHDRYDRYDRYDRHDRHDRYDHENYFFSLSYGNHRQSNRYSSGAFVGGLLLGSVLTHSYSTPDSPNYYYSSTPTPIIREVVVRQERNYAVQPSVNRRLLRDLQGRCFEVHRDNGTEVRTELLPESCNF